ncbi:MAG: ankyrin repeat domain-containing protein, partial [Burkholderiales bacterium]
MRFPTFVLAAAIAFAQSAVLQIAFPEPAEAQSTAGVIEAVTAGDAGAVEKLLRAGGDPNARAPDGDTGLHIAAGRGQVVMIKVLLERNADVNARGNGGATP